MSDSFSYRQAFWEEVRKNPDILKHNGKLHTGPYPPRPGTICVGQVLDMLFENVPMPLILKYFSARVAMIELHGEYERNQQLAWEIFEDMQENILAPSVLECRPQTLAEDDVAIDLYIKGVK